MKIVTIVGARPQFVKAAVVSRAICAFKGVEEKIIHTGQHFDFNMSDIFFEEMSIPKPNINLDINGLGHGAMTGQMLVKIEEILMKEKPDWVMVYGDTNSTLAGALAAKKLQIKIAHVEAGLRSFNLNMPEEINRILTDRISDLLFCPTERSIENLHREGFENFDCKIVRSGDVMFDAVKFYAPRSQKPDMVLPEKFVLCTVHRAENTDDLNRLRSIFKALEEISGKTQIILPLHPRTKLKLESIGYDLNKSRIHFLPSIGYLGMLWLLERSELVITDSGGLQKEAYFFGKTCITLRDETEWIELVEQKVNFIAGSDDAKIVDCFNNINTRKTEHFNKALYGNGNAAQIIIEELLKNQ